MRIRINMEVETKLFLFRLSTKRWDICSPWDFFLQTKFHFSASNFSMDFSHHLKRFDALSSNFKTYIYQSSIPARLVWFEYCKFDHNQHVFRFFFWLLEKVRMLGTIGAVMFCHTIIFWRSKKNHRLFLNPIEEIDFQKYLNQFFKKCLASD